MGAELDRGRERLTGALAAGGRAPGPLWLQAGGPAVPGDRRRPSAAAGGRLQDLGCVQHDGPAGRVPSPGADADGGIYRGGLGAGSCAMAGCQANAGRADGSRHAVPAGGVLGGRERDRG